MARHPNVCVGSLSSNGEPGEFENEHGDSELVGGEQDGFRIISPEFTYTPCSMEYMHLVRFGLGATNKHTQHTMTTAERVRPTPR
jgi:hypothetical protein